MRRFPVVGAPFLEGLQQRPLLFRLFLFLFCLFCGGYRWVFVGVGFVGGYVVPLSPASDAPRPFPLATGGRPVCVPFPTIPP